VSNQATQGCYHSIKVLFCRFLWTSSIQFHYEHQLPELLTTLTSASKHHFVGYQPLTTIRGWSENRLPRNSICPSKMADIFWILGQNQLMFKALDQDGETKKNEDLGQSRRWRRSWWQVWKQLKSSLIHWSIIHDLTHQNIIWLNLFGGLPAPVSDTHTHICKSALEKVESKGCWGWQQFPERRWIRTAEAEDDVIWYIYIHIYR